VSMKRIQCDRIVACGTDLYRRRASRRASARGTTLVETMVAVVILAVGLVGVAQMFVYSTNTNREARRVTMTSILAQQKIEQLRALTWGFDDFGLAISDYTSNVTITPPTSTGGIGLQPSPTETLTTSTAGYVDYLDAYGAWLGTGATPPTGAVYVRRWSVEPLPTNPNNTLVFQVLVERVWPTTSETEQAREISLKTRKSI
jgi:type II secretory pathway pseudopilin PulG